MKKEFLLVIAVLSLCIIFCSCVVDDNSSHEGSLSLASEASESSNIEVASSEESKTESETEISEEIQSSASAETSEIPSEETSVEDFSKEESSSDFSQDDLDGMGIPTIYDRGYGGYYREYFSSLTEIEEIIGPGIVDPYLKENFFKDGRYTEEFFQLPSLVYFIKDFDIKKEDFIRVNNAHKELLIEHGMEYEDQVFTDREIDIIFSGDEEKIKKELKLDTAFLYNGRLYDVYQIYALAKSDKSKLKEMSADSDLISYLEYMRQYEDVIDNYIVMTEDQEFYNQPIDFMIYQINN